MDENTSERIAAVTLEIVEQEGADAVSMRRVAKAVGITPMAIYHHYPTREALLQAVTGREFERLGAFMRAHPARVSGDASFSKLLDFYLDYAFERPRVFDYLYSQARPDARKFPKDFRARKSPTMNGTADQVAAAIESGLLRDDDVWEIAMMLWAIVHGYLALYRAGRIGLDEKEFRALCHRALKRVFHGLKA
ncbi:transcriptional regulator, TetR family [Candidatus Koribacter versatilis Ellin345]|uniref:Transcriptional regulator, TetR family n=1 Tax=Koribacter versatilis (strain Ellin345) TaxID=204669 RepID=Q1II71_KORVE|nr:TetR/AcrR family transcriptional regulator [Candidatus Koribacter versatilis]ABF43429.1 transcriptional regulator, TetR family [Candidatus Koribacter versatilis Ellin345]